MSPCPKVPASQTRSFLDLLMKPKGFRLDFSRRDFLKFTGLAPFFPVFKGILAEAQTASEQKEPVQWLAQVFSAYEQQVTEFQKATGYKVVTTLKDQISTNQTLLTGGNEIFDVVSNTCSFWTPIQEKKVIKNVPVTDIPIWKKGSIGDLFFDPEKVIEKKWIAEAMNRFIYADPIKKDTFSLFPYICNFDTIGYNPKYVDKVDSWGALFDPKWKGKVALFDAPQLTVSSTAMYLVGAGLMEKPKHGEGDLTKEEVDQVIAFLIKKKREGQFRTLWLSYGDLVNLLASEEVWIADAWQPIVYDVRRAGTPCTYAEVKEGSNFWFGGMAPTEPGSRDNLQAVYALMMFHLGGWFAKFIQQYGYSTPSYPTEEVRKAMGPEYYGWAYEGKRTYKPVKEPYLFVPEKYEWSMEEGTPSPEGHRREGGSIEERIKHIGSIEIWPTENQYYLEKWEEFRNA